MIDISKRISSKKVHEMSARKTAIVAGWASQVKVMGKLAFIKLRDADGYIQLITLI